MQEEFAIDSATIHGLHVETRFGFGLGGTQATSHVFPRGVPGSDFPSGSGSSNQTVVERNDARLGAMPILENAAVDFEAVLFGVGGPITETDFVEVDAEIDFRGMSAQLLFALLWGVEKLSFANGTADGGENLAEILQPAQSGGVQQESRSVRA